MTDLRKLMLEELERRNYSQAMVRAYMAAVEDFARYFHRRPDQLGPDHIRQYQAYLFRERKLTANSARDSFHERSRKWLTWFHRKVLTAIPAEPPHLADMWIPVPVASIRSSLSTRAETGTARSARPMRVTAGWKRGKQNFCPPATFT
jgi:hypothetical protein